MWTNDKIIFVADVSAPPSMAAKKGDVKVIGVDIPLYYAKSAVKGGHARQVRDDEIDDVLIELGLKEPEPVKKTKRRKENTDVRDGKEDQESDTGKKDPAGKAG
jgi:hypothetical protein